jgi:four helix bundle protein
MHFEELRIYQIAVRLEAELFKHIGNIPKGYKIEQVDQITRSSSSVSANIVEGWNRRFYPRDFIRFLSIALGSSDETQHHLIILYNKKCIMELVYQEFRNEYKNLSIKILNLINHLRKKHKIINAA